MTTPTTAPPIIIFVPDNLGAVQLLVSRDGEGATTVAVRSAYKRESWRPIQHFGGDWWPAP